MLATACSNDEVVKVAENSAAIGFSTFVNNSTRAEDNTAENLADLNVWGVTKGDGGLSNIFNAELVDKVDGGTNVGSVWKYHSTTRYWIMGNDYRFAAVAPANASGVASQEMTIDNGLSFEFDNSNAEADLDLLYAAWSETAVSAEKLGQGVVNLDFVHMLSKVKFEFVNGITNENFAFSVSDVTITNATSKASFTEGEEKAIVWSAEEADANYSVDFISQKTVLEGNGKGSDNSEHKYLIPLKDGNNYTAKFTITLYNKDMKDNKYKAVKTYPREVEIGTITYQNNYSYKFVATITEENISGTDDDLLPITFNVNSVKGWQDASVTEIPGLEKTEE